jgi:trk system potassium uptake protein
MYIVIAGAGKVGWNLARELRSKDHEVTLIESERDRYMTVEEELEHNIHYGDASELWVLERAGVVRADMVIAVTGDDEDNILISQVAKEKYLVDHTIARVNNPRNVDHFELLGIRPVVSATDLILSLIEHEVPHHGLVHLLDLKQEQLEIIELEVMADAPAAGRRIEELQLPDGCLVVSVLRNGSGFVPNSETVIEGGDEVLAVLNPGDEGAVCALFAPRPDKNGRGNSKAA